MVKRYSTKPEFIEVVRNTGDNLNEMMAFCPEVKTIRQYPHAVPSRVDVMIDDLWVVPGDYIGKDADNNYFPIAQETLDEQYNEEPEQLSVKA